MGNFLFVGIMNNRIKCIKQLRILELSKMRRKENNLVENYNKVRESINFEKIPFIVNDIV